MEESMIRTFIWGSCVSRDTFEFLPADRYELAHYVARQSWLSHGNQVKDLKTCAMQSPFQIRMAEGDSIGDALQRLEDNLPVDLVLLDLVDERLGVVITETGVVTRSVDRIASGIQEEIDGAGKVVDFESDEFLDLWSSAAIDVRDELVRLGLFEHALVLAPTAALVDDQAVFVPPSFGMSAATLNQQLERHFSVLESLGFATLHLPTTLAASEHKWGRAAFHYHGITYAELVEGIRAFAEEKSAPEILDPQTHAE